ncbi:MAG: hypothetical protein VKK05_05820 [Synechococcus sp.]|nr:hypothetical protein [Synechococcus sp.]
MQQRKPGSKVQIIDVLSLQVVTGYTRDPQGRLLMESQSSVAAGRSWSLAKAAQLIRKDARPLSADNEVGWRFASINCYHFC